MKKNFLLMVEHECGKANMLVNTPDLFEAMKIYQERVAGLFGRDKSTIVPRILKAEILPVHFVEEKE